MFDSISSITILKCKKPINAKQIKCESQNSIPTT